MPAKKKKNRSFGKMVRFVMQQRGSPEAIALGAAIGMFIAFSPTTGIQFILVLIVATLLKANRLAALVPIWITNVFTVPPIYAFTWKLGSYFMPDEPSHKALRILTRTTEKIANLGWFVFPSQAGRWLETSWDILLPLFIGGAIVGTMGALLTYPLTLWGVRRYRVRRSLRLQQRRALRDTSLSTNTDQPLPSDQRETDNNLP